MASRSPGERKHTERRGRRAPSMISARGDGDGDGDMAVGAFAWGGAPPRRVPSVGVVCLASMLTSTEHIFKGAMLPLPQRRCCKSQTAELCRAPSVCRRPPCSRPWGRLARPGKGARAGSGVRSSRAPLLGLARGLWDIPALGPAAVKRGPFVDSRDMPSCPPTTRLGARAFGFPCAVLTRAPGDKHRLVNSQAAKTPSLPG